MKCNHCDICSENEKCTPEYHICKNFIDKSSINDMKPTEWNPSKK